MAAGTHREVSVAFEAAPTTTTPTTTTPTTTTPTHTQRRRPSRPPIPRLTKVGFTARGKGGTIAATLVVPREARGSVLLLQRKKTMARWKLSLAQGRRRPAEAGAPPAKRLVRTALPPADRDGNGVVLNRNLRIR